MRKIQSEKAGDGNITQEHVDRDLLISSHEILSLEMSVLCRLREVVNQIKQRESISMGQSELPLAKDDPNNL
jgi:hypothetical protein